MLYLPPPSLRIPSDPDIVVCRCEEVTSGQIDEAVKLGCPGPNQLKFFSRCGMGACQGRNCGLTTTEILARATGEEISLIAERGFSLVEQKEMDREPLVVDWDAVDKSRRVAVASSLRQVCSA